ncbi:MAG: HRDC domain-containing protein [Myxococcota bacterium]
MVEDEPMLREVVDKLERSRVIGIDTESDSSYAYQEKVCLIQVSDLEADYIIDPLLIGDVSSLGPVLADPSIVKVLHGADYDIVCLDRDYGFRFRGLFDTLVAAQLIGMERIGLADLIDRYFGIPIDKQYQRHNWGLRPLEDEHVAYARGDTHFLLALHEIMIKTVRRRGRLRHLREECRLLQQKRWTGKGHDPEGWIELKGASDLDAVGMKVLRRLYQYRDKQARRQDRPVYKVIPDGVLLELAEHRPHDRGELDDLFRRKQAMRRRYGSGLLEAIHQGLDDPKVEVPEKRKRKKTRPRTALRTRLRGRQAERVMASLKQWRNDLVDKEPGLTPFTVASNSTLKWIASLRPQNLEELEQVPEVRKWQVVDFGEEILELLDRVAPAGAG